MSAVDRAARHAGAAQAALAAGEHRTALEAARAAVRLRPSDPDLLCLLAVALFEAGEHPLAQEAADRAVALGQGNVSTRVRARYNRAVLLRRIGDAAGACRALEELLELSPDHPRARIELAQALAALGDFSRAVTELSEHVRQWPADRIAWRDHAIFAERAGKWQTAAAAWQAVLALDGTDDEARLRLCAVQAELSGITPEELDGLRSDHPRLAHAIERAVAHAGRGCLRL
ncbi:MAG TPA: tetratricopeptide repeat protein [Geminicoccus sp.]|uniref:tetratricopeptide repeat protein n=1 Tax=Geminicoccus sp. TaxID=2024832 RepID=UPI002B756F9C|nr:tetratricopeptide repeat protein [Geminicoccus sp.]HWL72027.1 tetratricopeptide repeat protein [Geminicoccus sp.]